MTELYNCKRYSVQVKDRPGIFGDSTEGFELIDRYEISPNSTALGWGAYGCVVAATDKQTGEEVAIKKLKNLFDSPQRERASLREVRLLTHFTKNTEMLFEGDDGSHDNIVKVIDVFITLGSESDSQKTLSERYEEYNTVYMVLKKFDLSLRQVISDKWNLTELHRVFFMCQLLRGVTAVHSAGAVHRDLKPENILIQKTDDGSFPLALCDLGSGRGLIAKPNPSEIFITDTNWVTTSSYIPPEALSALQTIDTASNTEKNAHLIDIWSIGCIYAELIYGQELFRDSRGAPFQLRKMIEVIGPPPKHIADSLGISELVTDKQFGEEGGGEVFLKKFFDGKKLMGEPPSECEIKLIARMLSWEPRCRPPAHEAIAHETFSRKGTDFDCHDPEDEPTAEKFNFVDPSDSTETRTMLWDMMLEYHPEFVDVDVGRTLEK